MIATKYISRYDEDDTKVYYMVPRPAYDRADIAAIETSLRLTCEAEATKLYRLAWRMTRKGCSPESIRVCREEASRLHISGNLWDVLNPFVVWTYAFKF